MDVDVRRRRRNALSALLGEQVAFERAPRSAAAPAFPVSCTDRRVRSRVAPTNQQNETTTRVMQFCQRGRVGGRYILGRPNKPEVLEHSFPLLR